MYLQIYCCVSEHNTKTGKSPVMYCLDISWILCKCCISIVFATFGCKVTENIWNTQGLLQENANYLYFVPECLVICTNVRMKFRGGTAMPCRCPWRYTKYLTFLTYAKEKAILCVFCFSVISALRSKVRLNRFTVVSCLFILFLTTNLSHWFYVYRQCLRYQSQ